MLCLKQPTRLTRDILHLHPIPRQSCRHASGRSNPYPYPTHPNPHPHQIFHLSRSATQQQIKERYYDLVRIYHPDSPIARKYPPHIAQTRFQSISKAYDLMRGKSAITGQVSTSRVRHTDPARFRPRASRRPHFDQDTGDERWKERVLFGATVLTVVAFVAQTAFARRKAVAHAASSSRTSSSGPKYPLADEALAESPESYNSRSS